MSKIPYTKPPLTVQEQIELLKTRGLQIPDEKRATRYLRNISYFHLSGYMYPFLADKKQHLYKPNSGFDTITPTNTFRNKLKDLFVKYPNIGVTAMGFPKDWKNDPFWS